MWWTIIGILAVLVIGVIIGLMIGRHNPSIAKKVDDDVNNAVDAGVDRIKEKMNK